MTTEERTRSPRKRPPLLNRFMSAFVRSPFGRLVDRGILLLTVFGRRTGRPYTFPVQYVQDAGVLWVLVGSSDEKTWWRNLSGGAPVEILLRRRTRKGIGEAFTHEEHPEVVDEGLRRYVERFPGTAKRLGLAGDDREAAASAREKQTIVRIRLED